MTADEVYLTGSEAYLVYNWYSGKTARLQVNNTIAAGYEGHMYAMVSPTTAGWTLLGETDKIVSVSSLRFAKATATTTSLVVDVVGVAGEAVLVCAVKPDASTSLCQTVQFATATTKIVTFNA